MAYKACSYTLKNVFAEKRIIKENNIDWNVTVS